MFKLLLALILLPLNTWAVPLLLDSEFDYWLNKTAAPFIKKAELNPDQIKIRVIMDDTVNAFVTPDRGLYMHSGLILKATHPNQVAGVLAHEIGHLKARHHLSMQTTIGNQKTPLIASAIAGLAALAAGQPQVGAAIFTGSQAAAVSNILRHSRTNERHADQIALELLDETSTSAQGMLNFFDMLRSQELLYSENPEAYLLTHPLTRQRLDHVRTHIAQKSVTPTNQLDPTYFKRLQAKLYAFNNSPAATLRKYLQDTTPAGDYARLIAYAMQGKLQDSLNIVNKMLKAEPQNPFLYDLKGQILLDLSDLVAAQKAFKTALSLQPDLPITRWYYGQSLMAQQNYKAAIEQFLRVRQDMPDWLAPQTALATAYGKKGELFNSHILLSEIALKKENIDDAKLHLRLARRHSDNSTAQEDKINLIEQALAQQD